MKKAKREGFACVVRMTIDAIKNNLSKYSEGNPTMYFEDIDIAFNGDLVDECFNKYCDASFNN